MTILDPIIAVKDVGKSAKWYEAIFGCTNKHGGGDFAVLISENGEVLLNLHKWGEHEHPTMISPNNNLGNGLILYFRTENINHIYQNVKEIGYPMEEDMGVNPNSHKKEFSLRDLDGYFITISEFHKYEG